MGPEQSEYASSCVSCVRETPKPGQSEASSPDLTLNGGYRGSSTNKALHWELKLF